MNIFSFRRWFGFVVTVTMIAVFLPAIATSHCDTMNGPVVMAAKKALETGNVNLVLIWVQKSDEGTIKDAFQKTLSVRKLGPEARKLADLYFFETLVRIHRAGEGVAYTGLKPAETEVEPGIAAADHAIETGSPEEMVRHLDESIHHNLDMQYRHVMESRNFRTEDIEAGRAYVRAYVLFIHYVERLHEAATQPVEGHIH